MGKVFLSYCHKDAHHLAKLRQHTQRLQESKLVELWHDQAIAPGEPWADSIRGNLDDSRLVIALVSPDFLQSEWCVAELGRAFELREKRAVLRLKGADPTYAQVVQEVTGGHPEWTALVWEEREA